MVALFAIACVIGWAPSPARADWIRDGEWQLTALHARSAWQVATGAGVIVAVLDSGVDATHADLVGQVLPGTDLVDGSTDGRVDFVGHGTTVAALIAGRSDDTNGVAGIAPQAKILPVRVLDKENRYSDASVIARGVRWAVDHGARVINLSLGGSGESTDLADAISYAQQHEVVLVACTGNVAAGGPASVWYPARERGVIAVAGLVAGTPSDTPWPGGLTGPQTVLSAPAADLLGAKPGGYWRVQGTSFAAPLVAGTAALLRSRWPDITAANVVNRLIRTAHDLGAPGRDDRYGFGEIDPVAALTRSVSSVSRNPLGAVTTASGWGASSTSSASPTATSAHGRSAGVRSRTTRAQTMSTGTAQGESLSKGIGQALVLISSVIALGALMALTRRQRIRRNRPSPSPSSPSDPLRPPPPLH